MVLDRLGEAVREAEKKLGLPPLLSVAESLNNLPDPKQLKLIKDTLEVAERVARTAPELDKVISIIQELKSMEMDKLKKLDTLLKRIESIMKTAPQDLLDFLASLKEE